MKNILITGGSGFIGSSICDFFLKKNYNVFNYDLINKKKFEKNYFFIKGDITDKKKLFNSFKNIHLNEVVHLAYINGTQKFYEIPFDILNIASKGIINLCEFCEKKKIKTLFLASSSEVYNEPLNIPTKENEILKISDIFNPRFSYGGGKIFSEIYAQNFLLQKKTLKRLIIFRPHNIYGESMGNGHVIPQICKKIIKQFFKKKIKIKIQGTGNEIRSFMHIDDFINAFKYIYNSKSKNEVFNIGNNDPLKINELIKKISKLINRKIYVYKTSLALNSPKIRIPDNRKITKLGYKKNILIDDGLKRMLKREFKKNEKKN